MRNIQYVWRIYEVYISMLAIGYVVQYTHA